MKRAIITASVLALALVGQAHAYTGPGLGLGTIMVVLGFIGSIFVAIFAAVWYPIKRMLRRKKLENQPDAVNPFATGEAATMTDAPHEAPAPNEAPATRAAS